ncbi:MAG: hypothetical protein ACRCWS_07400 [Propionibacteriaceae bacterium]
MNEELETQLKAALKRIEALEKQVENLQGRIPVATEETIMALTAAACAYMGIKGKVRAIHYSNPAGKWNSRRR